MKRYGPRLVWVAGTRLFRYPATWATTGKEVWDLTNALGTL